MSTELEYRAVAPISANAISDEQVRGIDDWISIYDKSGNVAFLTSAACAVARIVEAENIERPLNVRCHRDNECVSTGIKNEGISDIYEGLNATKDQCGLDDVKERVDALLKPK